MTSGLLLLSELEVLAARDDELLLSLALLALQPKGHLFGGLGLYDRDKGMDNSKSRVGWVAWNRVL